MATSLTNNVLTFNNGSIKDVRNDLGICFPMSFNQSKTFNWNSGSSDSATISGSPGQVVSVCVRSSSGALSVTSSGGTWIWVYSYNQDSSSNLTSKATLQPYPWNYSENRGEMIGSISKSINWNSNYPYHYLGVIAYRLY